MHRERRRAPDDEPWYRQAQLQQPLAESECARQAGLRGLSPRGQVVVMNLAVVRVKAVRHKIRQAVDERV